MGENIDVKVTNGTLDPAFIKHEIADIEAAQKRQVRKIEFIINGDGTVTEKCYWKPVKFDRIRRITGYLTGTTDRWNDAKRHEESDRVKHGMEANRDG